MHGIVFRPRRVPLSASLVNEVVKTRIEAKNRIVQRKAAETTGVALAPETKLQTRIEAKENVSTERSS